MYCSECFYFRDDAVCSRYRKDVGYFQASCGEFEPYKKEEMEEKTCKGCGRTLPIDQFARNAAGPTGFCKECMSAKRKRKPANIEQSVVGVAGLSDEDLVNELRRRGFAGKLTKKIEFEV